MLWPDDHLLLCNFRVIILKPFNRSFRGRGRRFCFNSRLNYIPACLPFSTSLSSRDSYMKRDDRDGSLILMCAQWPLGIIAYQQQLICLNRILIQEEYYQQKNHLMHSKTNWPYRNNSEIIENAQNHDHNHSTHHFWDLCFFWSITETNDSRSTDNDKSN